MKRVASARHGVCIMGWRDENEEKGHCWRLINCPFDLFPRGQMTPITRRRRRRWIWVGSGCRLFRFRPSPPPRRSISHPLVVRHTAASPAPVVHHSPSSTLYSATDAPTPLLPLPLPWYTLFTYTLVFVVHPPANARCTSAPMYSPPALPFTLTVSHYSFYTGGSFRRM